MPLNLENGFLLANWQVRPHAGQFSTGWLRKTVRRVEPKAMQVLLTLAARPGCFLSKDELIATVWNGRPVSDDCLSGAIHALRHAFDDNPRDPKFIETRNNVGYRLIAPVRRSPSRARAVVLAASLPLIALVVFFLSLDNTSQPTDLDPLTIAVLPFANQSGSATDDYFASAMTDALISDLAQTRRVRVISRTSVTNLGTDAGSAQDIANALGADMLVEGSVQTSDGNVRVSAQLIDPFATEHLWSEQFHRTRGNVLELQRDVSREIAARIGVAIGYPDTMAKELPADDMQIYMQSRYLLATEEVPAAKLALRGFQDVTAMHPGFAPALLGQAEAQLFLFKVGINDHGTLHDALEAATRFEKLYGATPASHRCIGQIHLFLDWNFAAAEQRYRQAILQNASDTIARHRYAWLLVAQQRYSEAKIQIQQIRILDPMYYARPELAMLMLYANEIDAAIVEFERVDSNSTLHKSTLRVMASAYWAAGREDDARQTLVRMLQADTNTNTVDIDELQALSSADLLRHILQVKLFRSSIAAAGFHALLGETDAALGNLELALKRHDPYLFYVAALPELAILHTQPRFRAILRDVGISVANKSDTNTPKLSSAIIRQSQDDNHDLAARYD